jgi:hypothetical protein
MGYRTVNYGSVLQAVATMEMLKKCNYNPIALNLNNLWNVIYKRKIKYYLLSGDMAFLLKSKARQLTRYIDYSYYRKLKNREIKFTDFINHNIERTSSVASFDEAGKLSTSYDCVLLGSDQVWLPSSVMTDVYTLSFVDKTVRTVAYAPSFGISDIKPKYWEKYSKMFNDIDYIALREQRGKEIVEEISGRECPVVADPVLMLDRFEWNEVIKPYKIKEEKYIFCYLLGRNRWQRKWIKNFAKNNGYKTVGLIHLDEKIGYDEKFYDECLIDISPDYFLNLIRNADIVFTDSFHAMCFSLIEHKEFGCFKRFNEKNKVSTNSRIDSLMSMLQLNDRIIRKETPNKMYDSKIDYDCIDKKLKAFREVSYKFLTESIG